MSRKFKYLDKVKYWKEYQDKQSEPFIGVVVAGFTENIYILVTKEPYESYDTPRELIYADNMKFIEKYIPNEELVKKYNPE